jgi:hypothetical protein
MGAYGTVRRLEDGLLGHDRRPGHLVPGILLIAVAALALETYGVGVGAYEYGDWPLKLDGVPLGVLVMWAAAGLLSWRIAEGRGVAAGVAAVVALDALLIEPVAHWAHLWWWTSGFTPHLGPFGTVGNVVAWTGMCVLGVVVLRRVDAASSPAAGASSHGA